MIDFERFNVSQIAPVYSRGYDDNEIACGESRMENTLLSLIMSACHNERANRM